MKLCISLVLLWNVGMSQGFQSVPIITSVDSGNFAKLGASTNVFSGRQTATDVIVTDSLGCLNFSGTNIYSLNFFRAPAAGEFQFNARSVLKSPADGILGLYNNGTNSFKRLQFGGTAAAFPALARDGTTLRAVLADSSAPAPMAMDKITTVVISAALTDGAPTDAEIDAATSSTPAGKGIGWQTWIKDSDGTGLMYRVVSDGTDWYWSSTTKAL